MASTKNWGFCDLSLSRNYDVNKLYFLERLGYNTIAMNTHVEEPSEEPKKKKKKGEVREPQDYIPAPVEIRKDLTENLKLSILQRVTIEFSESSIAHKINRSENIKKYDFVAVVPKTLQAFQYACGTLDIDIISFEPETRIPFKVSRKLYRQAVDRGIFFELMYSPAIRDTTARKNIISTAHMYHAVGKSKNIIVTSGAQDSTQVRDVHDVINLGFILGLNSNQSLDVIRSNTRKLIVKAEGRKCGKLYMTVRTLTENDENKTPASYTRFL
ncbi:ribonuclease P protein subunit p30 [Cydia amplana]|uniref:ribonuclease P protein subunit p30 n=1 Tax=Cydia amplana TaxID=1869771 RepID=UPI002FE53BBC